MASNAAKRLKTNKEGAVELPETDTIDGFTFDLRLRESSAAADRALREDRTLTPNDLARRMRAYVERLEAREGNG